jgi:hypothetical protein
MTLLKSTEDTYTLLQPGHFQPPQSCILRLFDSLELGLEEVKLKLFVGIVVLELAIHADIAVEAPIPILMDCLFQGCITHSGTLEEFQEPVGRGQNHVVVIAVVVRGRIDLLDPGDLVRSMLLGKPRNAPVGELLDPVGRLPHPILDGDGKARASSIAIEDIPLGAFFSGEGSAVVNEARPEEFELLSLGIPLPGPPLPVLSMLAFALFKGVDETACDVSDRVKVVRKLDGSCGSARRIDRS